MSSRSESYALNGASSPPRASLRERALDRLQSRRGVWIIAALGFCLALPSLSIGLSTDDHLHARTVADGVSVLDYFHLRDAVHQREIGRLSWWINPSLSLNFLRPLAALTIAVDNTLWPNAPWLMHLESALLYGALVALAWLLYRALLPTSPRIAALAALMFAIDEGHAAAVGWLSSRNTVMANLFGFAAVLFYLRARSHKPTLGWRLAAVSCTGLALASGEAGVAAFAYLGAYALVFEPGRVWRRLAAIGPELAVFAVWAAIYVAGGYGARGVSYYRDLAATLVEGPLDLPTWLLSLLGPSVVGTTLMAPVGIVRLVTLALVLPLAAALVRALPRTRETLFFTLGALGCLATVFTTLPQDRVVMSASFGVFGLLATFIATTRAHACRFVRTTRMVFIAIHLVLAPLLFAPLLDIGRPIDRGARALAAAVPTAPVLREVVVLNTPIELVTLYAHELLGQRDSQHSTISSLHQLYAGAAEVEVARIDETTLELRVAGGWARRPIEGVFASVDAMPPAGITQQIGPLAITVRETEPDGRPRTVQFRFADALEAPQRLWLEWRGTALQPWKPPPVGATRSLERLTMLRSLPQ
jgi:hypothetical protein